MSEQIEKSKKLCEVFLRINPGKFHRLKFILEGYDNLALLSSVTQKPGIVLIHYPEELAEELFLLLSAVAAEIQAS